MAYTKTVWVNDQAPDIDADNLNKIETGIYNAHTSLNTKANQSTLATVESSSSASKAYSVGDYLVYNGILYRVTAAIAKNATLTPNTNIEATTTGAELTSLNNGLTSLFYVKSYSAQYTVAANGTIIMRASDFGAAAPSGYTGIAVTSAVTGNSAVVLRGFYADATGNGNMLVLNNTSGSSVAATAQIRILYAKSTSMA